MDALVACAADDEGLAAACCHPPGPVGRGALPLAAEVFECPGVAHFDLHTRSAQLALVGHEPLDDLGAVAPDAGGLEQMPAAIQARRAQNMRFWHT